MTAPASRPSSCPHRGTPAAGCTSTAAPPGSASRRGRQRAGLRQLRRPADLAARPGATEPVPLSPEPAEPAGAALRRPGARPGRARGAVGARGAPGRHGQPAHRRDPAGRQRRRRSGRVREVAGGSDFLASPADLAGRRAGWPGSPGTTPGCRGTAPSCGSPTLDPAGRATDVRTLLGGPTESVRAPAVGRRPHGLRRSPTGPAGGTSTPSARPAATRGRCTSGPRSSPSRCGPSAAAATSSSTTGGSRSSTAPRPAGSGCSTRRPACSTTSTSTTPTSAGSSADGHRLFTTAASPTESRAADRGRVSDRARSPTLRRVGDSVPDAGYLSVPESIVVTGEQRPRRARPRLPAGQRRRRVRPASCRPTSRSSHGGPTAQSTRDSERRASPTSPAAASASSTSTTAAPPVTAAPTGSGCAVSGASSTSRTRVTAVQALVERGLADAARLAIRGGSAGGWTALAALTRHRRLRRRRVVLRRRRTARVRRRHARLRVALPRRPGRPAAGVARPLRRAGAAVPRRRALNCPVLLLQGAEDKVVPPAQSEMFRDALARKGIPHAYLLFEGEQHGFRRAENQIALAGGRAVVLRPGVRFHPAGRAGARAVHRYAGRERCGTVAGHVSSPAPPPVSAPRPCGPCWRRGTGSS